MKNTFIAYNIIRNQYSVNLDHGFRTAINGFLGAKITTLDEYREWVFQWKAYEKELVKAIRFFRNLKNENKLDSHADPDGYLVNHYWRCKILLREVARNFYEARVNNKNFFKESNFFEKEELNNSVIQR